MKKFGVALGILIAAVIAIGALWLMFMGPIPEEKLKETGIIGPDSHFVDVDGVRTRYVTAGDAEKTIVLLHGFSSSLYTWHACMEPLSKEYRVIALDLEGFGFSGKPDTEYTIDGYVDFVIHFMDALKVKTATLCGNSMGGNIAWRAALKYPDRVDKLILVDASGYYSGHSGMPFFIKLGRLPGVGEFFGSLVTRDYIRASLRSAYYDDSKVTDQTVDAYYYPMRTEGAMHAVLARLRTPQNETEQWENKITTLKLPTLIVWGANDTWKPRQDPDRFHLDIKGSKLVTIRECGHVPQEEKPGEFSAAVLKFMSGREHNILTEGEPPPDFEEIIPLESGLTV